MYSRNIKSNFNYARKEKNNGRQYIQKIVLGWWEKINDDTSLGRLISWLIYIFKLQQLPRTIFILIGGVLLRHSWLAIWLCLSQVGLHSAVKWSINTKIIVRYFCGIGSGIS